MMLVHAKLEVKQINRKCNEMMLVHAKLEVTQTFVRETEKDKTPITRPRRPRLYVATTAAASASAA
jgi:hypothetical protein